MDFDQIISNKKVTNYYFDVWRRILTTSPVRNCISQFYYLIKLKSQIFNLQNSLDSSQNYIMHFSLGFWFHPGPFYTWEVCWYSFWQWLFLSFLSNFLSGRGPGVVSNTYSSFFLIWKEESMSIFLTFSGSWAWSAKGNFIQFTLAKQETVRVNNGLTSFLVSDS